MSKVNRSKSTTARRIMRSEVSAYSLLVEVGVMRTVLVSLIVFCRAHHSLPAHNTILLSRSLRVYEHPDYVQLRRSPPPPSRVASSTPSQQLFCEYSVVSLSRPSIPSSFLASHHVPESRHR